MWRTATKNLIRWSRAEGLGIFAASLSISSPQGVYRAATSLVVGSNPTWFAQLLALSMSRTVIFGKLRFLMPTRSGCHKKGFMWKSYKMPDT